MYFPWPLYALFTAVDATIDNICYFSIVRKRIILSILKNEFEWFSPSPNDMK